MSTGHTCARTEVGVHTCHCTDEPRMTSTVTVTFAVIARRARASGSPTAAST
ncbi:MAG TPA: hypothetical protein VIC85_14235 [Ktedonobacterales bacterium]